MDLLIDWAATPVPKLEHHWPVLLISAAFWTVSCSAVHGAAGIFSKSYRTMTSFQQFDWNVHIISFIHAIVISLLAIPILQDPVLESNRIFGYSHYAGTVYAITCGYFLWDTVICLYKVKENGIGFVMHGILCFLVYILSFRPMLQYYGAVFLMFELR